MTAFDYRDRENDSRAKASPRMNMGLPECQEKNIMMAESYGI
jgi:hypothetical protein